jgi:hypothetical protein
VFFKSIYNTKEEKNQPHLLADQNYAMKGVECKAKIRVSSKQRPKIVGGFRIAKVFEVFSLATYSFAAVLAAHNLLTHLLPVSELPTDGVSFIFQKLGTKRTEAKTFYSRFHIGPKQQSDGST